MRNVKTSFDTKLHRRFRPLLLAIALVFALTGCNAFLRLSYRGTFRDQWQHPAQVIEALAIHKGEHVADLDAGAGYFTFRLADAVGPQGKVYAVDVDQAMVDFLRDRISKEGYTNIEVIPAREDDARLPLADIDLIFTCNVYHQLEDRAAYFGALRRSLRPDARVAIIDYNDKPFFPWLFGHMTPSEAIRRDLESAGYRLRDRYSFLSDQNFLVFARDGGQS